MNGLVGKEFVWILLRTKGMELYYCVPDGAITHDPYSAYEIVASGSRRACLAVLRLLTGGVHATETLDSVDG